MATSVVIYNIMIHPANKVNLFFINKPISLASVKCYFSVMTTDGFVVKVPNLAYSYLPKDSCLAAREDLWEPYLKRLQMSA